MPRLLALAQLIACVLITAAAAPAANATPLPARAESEQSIGLPREQAPLTGERPESRTGFARTIFSLAAVVALIVLAAATARMLAQKRGGVLMAMGAAGRAPSGVVDVLARYPLGGGQLLVIFRIGPRVVVVNQVPGRRGSMRTICEFDDPDQAADLVARCRDADGSSFMERFRAASSEADLAIGTLQDPAPATPPTRLAHTNEAGDRVELLGTYATPDVMPEPTPPQSVRQQAAEEADPVEALRERLARLRAQGAAG